MDIKDFEEILKNIIEVDKTPDYGYRKLKRDALPSGEFPEAGCRWKTPREIARESLGHITLDRLKEAQNENNNKENQ